MPVISFFQIKDIVFGHTDIHLATLPTCDFSLFLKIISTFKKNLYFLHCENQFFLKIQLWNYKRGGMYYSL